VNKASKTIPLILSYPGERTVNKDTTLVLTNASQLLTLADGERPKRSVGMSNLGLIERGSVVVSGGRIVDVGTTGEVERRNRFDSATRVIDCSGKVVCPGFVDPHTHPVFAGFRLDEYEMRTAGATYQEIAEKGGGINASIQGVRKASMEELLEMALPRLDRFLLHGTTTIEAKSGYGLSVEDELKSLRIIAELNKRHPLDIVPTFLGAHAIPPEFKNDRKGYLEILTGEMIPAIAEEKLAGYCDVFVEEGYFTADEARELLEAAGQHGLRGRIHADELSSTGGAELAAELGAITADHLVHISVTGMEAMARGGVIAVLLPGTTFFLGSSRYAPAREMIDRGVAVALATDFNPGSSTTLNQQQVMTIAVTQMGMKPAEAMTAATINAACAVGMEALAGSIEEGKQADLIVMDVKDFREIPYIFGVNHCESVVKRGRIVVESGKNVPIDI
jgi:imidazolonepropionase